MIKRYVALPVGNSTLLSLSSLLYVSRDVLVRLRLVLLRIHNHHLISENLEPTDFVLTSPAFHFPPIRSQFRSQTHSHKPNNLRLSSNNWQARMIFRKQP